MKRSAALLALVVLFLTVSTVSAIEMKRAHSFTSGEEKSYNFLGDEYTVRVMNMFPAGGGRAEVVVNGKRTELSAGIPRAFRDIQITLDKATNDEARLNMVWTAEQTKPDAKVAVTLHRKQEIRAGARIFSLIARESNPVLPQITIEINGQKVFFQEGDKKELRDGSIVRVNEVHKGGKGAEISIWASDTEIKQEEKESYNAEYRLGRSERRVVDVKGVRIELEIKEISQNRATVVVDSEIVTLAVKEEHVLNSGIKVRMDAISTQQPAGLVISIKVPEELESETPAVFIQKTVSRNQVETVAAEGKSVTASPISFNKEEGTAILLMGGQEQPVKEGDQIMVGAVKVIVKTINFDSFPPRVTLVFEFPSGKQVIKKPEIPEMEEGEVEEGSDTVEEETGEKEPDPEENISKEEIPQPRPDGKPDETLGKRNAEPLSFGQSTRFIWNSIAGFVTGIFSIFS